MHILNLGGSCWKAEGEGIDHAIPATVPGCIHSDLLIAGKIPDPFDRDNEEQVQWVSNQPWTYRRSFQVTERALAESFVMLEAEGLDTLAVIEINGQETGRADNMFRRWRFDVKDALRVGENEIAVRFDPALEYCARRQEERPLYGWNEDFWPSGCMWLRKMQCNFGWDWGPRLVTCGIWRGLQLTAWSGARLRPTQFAQEHKKNSVKLTVQVNAEVEGKGRYEAEVSILVPNSDEVITKKKMLRAGVASIPITISNPQLWFPNGMGEQPLYEIHVALRHSGEEIDSHYRCIGLRTIELQREKEKDGETFRFAVNGQPLFAKGANWIPADALLTRVTGHDYERLVTDAAEANMNMLRVWGGGIYEPDEFYHFCDEMGILIWQDFMFACAGYPAFDEAFVENVRAEVCDNVERLAHHACIALWCGNNEIEQGLAGPEWTEKTMAWDDYRHLFEAVIPKALQETAPGSNYWPGSPHTPPPGKRDDFNNLDRGDTHLWEVWHGRKPFEWYRTVTPRFCSEFGFQSFPEPRTIASFTHPADRNLTAPIMEKRQRSAIGNGAIIHQMMEWFRLPNSFDGQCRVSQMLQGLAMQYAVEHWRRQTPRCMGALYWQFNDCWPAISWSSIDFHGRWKALHYAARRFFAPVLVSAVENLDNHTIEVHAINDYPEDLEARYRWFVITPEGKVLGNQENAVVLKGSKAEVIDTLDFSELAEKHGSDNLTVWIELNGSQFEKTRAVALFRRPKQIDWRNPGLNWSIKGYSGEFTLTITVDKPALFLWIDTGNEDVLLSDNYFHLRPGVKKQVVIEGDKSLNTKKLQKKIQIYSLRDTYHSGKDEQS